MKQIKNIMLACVVFAFSSCNFLDFDESTRQSEREAFNSYANVKSFIVACYNGLPSDFGAIGSALREAATDNAVMTDKNSSIYDMYTGKWSPINAMDNAWNTYDYIFRCNYFLETIKPEMIELFEWDDDYDKWLEEIDLHFLEARALRAFYFFELAKRYGDIPLVTRVLTTEEANGVTKTSFDDVIKFIVAECDTLAPLLPETYQGYHDSETGRATKGFVMALKARALLYAASPLHNPNNDTGKWEAAAKASMDIIMTGTYSLPDISSDPLFTKEGNAVLTSSQLIFERRNGKANSFEKRNYPVGYHVSVMATGGTTPTENLASLYEMKNGDAFDIDTHDTEMYYDASGNPTRDPRFYRVILADGAKLFGADIETFEGGVNNADDQVGATLTGYYPKRYISKVELGTPNAPQTTIEHHTVIYRYAEVLLNYAEAIYATTGSATGTTAVCSKSAIDAINEVRNAANMPPVLEVDFDMQYIRDERNRELAFEDHRFWDIRRWKIGEVIKDIKGMKIVKDASTGVKSYTIETVQNRVWEDKMYLYPIQQSERIINPNLGQNPGW